MGKQRRLKTGKERNEKERHGEKNKIKKQYLKK